MSSSVIDELFPEDEAPGDFAQCVGALISLIERRCPIDLNALNKALTTFQSQITDPFPTIRTTISTTAYNIVAMVFGALYVTFTLGSLIVVWSLVLAGVLYWTAALFISLIIIFVVFLSGALLQNSVLSYGNAQLATLESFIITYFTVTLPTVLGNTVCAYTNNYDPNLCPPTVVP